MGYMPPPAEPQVRILSDKLQGHWGQETQAASLVPQHWARGCNLFGGDDEPTGAARRTSYAVEDADPTGGAGRDAALDRRGARVRYLESCPQGWRPGSRLHAPERDGGADRPQEPAGGGARRRLVLSRPLVTLLQPRAGSSREGAP